MFFCFLFFFCLIWKLPGHVAQSVMYLTDAYLTADPGVASSILAQSHTIVEIDHNFCGHSPHFIQEVVISVRTLISVWTIACKNTFHKAWFTTKWCVSSVGVKSWIYGPCSLYPNYFDDLGWVVSSTMVSCTHKETGLIFKHEIWTR